MLARLGFSISDLLGARVLDGVQATSGARLPAGVSNAPSFETGAEWAGVSISFFVEVALMAAFLAGNGAKVSEDSWFSSSEWRLHGEDDEDDEDGVILAGIGSSVEAAIPAFL